MGESLTNRYLQDWWPSLVVRADTLPGVAATGNVVNKCLYYYMLTLERSAGGNYSIHAELFAHPLAQQRAIEHHVVN